MRIFGYATQDLPLEEEVPKELAEISLCATPDELRRIGDFLAACAAEMERMGDAYDHVPLGDGMKEFDTASPHFVGANESTS